MNRKQSRIGSLAVLGVLCALQLRLFAAETVVPVSPGARHVVTAAENGAQTVFLLDDGATLELADALGADVVLKARVKVAANAAAHLAVAAGVSSVRLEGGLYALSGASLAVSGIGSLAVGKAGGVTAISTTPLDVATLTFGDAAATGLVLSGCVTVRRVPTTCPVAVAPGATLALMGSTDALAALGISGDYALTDFDLVILDKSAVPTDAVLTVAPGRTLAVKPCSANGDWAWAGRSDSDFRLPAIVLGGADARVLFRNTTYVEYKSCPVSGTGEVVFAPDSASANASLLYGPFSYDGVFAVDNASSVSTYTYGWSDAGTRTLRLANGATFRANGVASFASLSVSGRATLELLHNSRLTVGNVVSGNGLSVTALDGVGGGKADFIGTFPASFALTVIGPAYCLFGGGDPTGCLSCQTADGVTYLWPDAEGVVDCGRLPATDAASKATAWADGLVLRNLPPALPVKAKGTAKIVRASAPAGVVSKVYVEKDGVVTCETDDAAWQSELKLWIDPSTATFGPVGGLASNAATLDGCAVFASIADCRPEQTTYSLQNRRDATADKTKVNWQVYPLAMANACNGLTAFSCGPYQTSAAQTYVFDDGSPSVASSATQARRILVAKNGSVAETAPEPAGAVVMVFGSQNGGGAALIGTKSGAFGRTGTTCEAGLTTNTAHRVFVNGRRVADPAAERLSGGWDIVTVELDGESLSAFGWCGSDGKNNDYAHCGGQNYGEILVFADVPSDGVRIAAERYLARKWGLADKYAHGADSVELAGRGMVKAGAGDWNVSGSFAGTVELAGGTLTVAPSVAAPTAEVVPTDGLLGWFDPESADSLLLNRDTTFADAQQAPDRIWALYDRSRPAHAAGDAALFGVRVRRPLCVREARGDGPTRNWMHFDSEDNLRFVRLPLPDFASTTVTAEALPGAREIFVVQDSSRGGGTPVVDRIDASTVGTTIVPRRTADAAAPIWANVNGSTFPGALITDGVTRLNGVVVDGRTRGFTGGVEIFSFSTAADYAPLAFADYYNVTAAGKGAYEILGEILVYGKVLSEDARANVIAYLNGKWRGVLPSGGADLTRATVVGTGRVNVSRLSEAPRFAPSFTGTLTVAANEGCTFAVFPKEGRVEGACIAPGATLNLPAAMTATVTLGGRLSANEGTFTLIDCSGFVRETAWTLDLRARPGVRGTLRVAGGRLLLDVQGGGLCVIVR